MRGVVDSPALTPTASRDAIQVDAVARQIRDALGEVVVEHLKRMAEEDSARFLRIMESSLCRTVPLIPVLSFARIPCSPVYNVGSPCETAQRGARERSNQWSSQIALSAAPNNEPPASVLVEKP